MPQPWWVLATHYNPPFLWLTRLCGSIQFEKTEIHHYPMYWYQCLITQKLILPLGVPNYNWDHPPWKASLSLLGTFTIWYWEFNEVFQGVWSQLELGTLKGRIGVWVFGHWYQDIRWWWISVFFKLDWYTMSWRSQLCSIVMGCQHPPRLRHLLEQT